MRVTRASAAMRARRKRGYAGETPALPWRGFAARPPPAAIWIPAFAGMTGVKSGNGMAEFGNIGRKIWIDDAKTSSAT